MNKKERKANSVLAAAQMIANRRVQFLLKTKKDELSLKRVAPQPKKVEPQPKKVVVMPVEFNENEKFDTFEIVKMCKADYRIRVTRDWVKLIVPKRFKSITKAQEWCNRHRKEE